MHSPTEEHFEVVYKILRYLKRTLVKTLIFTLWGGEVWGSH